jgi:regulator of sigma E protease
LNLGILNLLPVPALDGGRLFFLFIELIRRKPLPAEKEGMVHFVGLVALMALSVFLMYKDIIKFNLVDIFR